MNQEKKNLFYLLIKSDAAKNLFLSKCKPYFFVLDLFLYKVLLTPTYLQGSKTVPLANEKHNLLLALTP